MFFGQRSAKMLDEEDERISFRRDGFGIQASTRMELANRLLDDFNSCQEVAWGYGASDARAWDRQAGK